MRLIDADELIKRIGKWMPKDPCGKEQTIEEVVATDIAVSVCMEIEGTPTAFDKEKVIEKLKDQYNYSRKVRDKNDNDYFEYWDGRTDSYKDAIEIVAKGGIE